MSERCQERKSHSLVRSPRQQGLAAPALCEFAYINCLSLRAGKIYVTFGSKDVAIEIGDPLTST